MLFVVIHGLRDHSTWFYPDLGLFFMVFRSLRTALAGSTWFYVVLRANYWSGYKYALLYFQSTQIAVEPHDRRDRLTQLTHTNNNNNCGPSLPPN